MTKAVLFSIVGLFLLGAVGTGFYYVFGKAGEEARHDIFKSSTAHIEGTIRTIQKYRIEYIQAQDEDARGAIAQMVIAEAQRISSDELPSDLVDFVSSLQPALKGPTQ